MSGSANVTSIDAVKRTRFAMMQFEAEVREALTDLMLECRRAVEWIEVDRANYWPRQVRLAMNQAAEARVALERCQLTAVSGDEPSCYDEKKALAKAKQRQRLCESKIDIVSRWQHKINHEAEEFETQIAKLSDSIDNDVPRAVAALERMIHALDKYAQSGDAGPPTSDAIAKLADSLILDDDKKSSDEGAS